MAADLAPSGAVAASSTLPPTSSPGQTASQVIDVEADIIARAQSRAQNQRVVRLPSEPDALPALTPRRRVLEVRAAADALPVLAPPAQGIPMPRPLTAPPALSALPQLGAERPVIRSNSGSQDTQASGERCRCVSRGSRTCARPSEDYRRRVSEILAQNEVVEYFLGPADARRGQKRAREPEQSAGRESKRARGPAGEPLVSRQLEEIADSGRMNSWTELDLQLDKLLVCEAMRGYDEMEVDMVLGAGQKLKALTGWMLSRPAGETGLLMQTHLVSRGFGVCLLPSTPATSRPAAVATSTPPVVTPSKGVRYKIRWAIPEDGSLATLTAGDSDRGLPTDKYRLCAARRILANQLTALLHGVSPSAAKELPSLVKTRILEFTGDPVEEAVLSVPQLQALTLVARERMLKDVDFEIDELLVEAAARGEKELTLSASTIRNFKSYASWMHSLFGPRVLRNHLQERGLTSRSLDEYLFGHIKLTW